LLVEKKTRKKNNIVKTKLEQNNHTKMNIFDYKKIEKKMQDEEKIENRLIGKAGRTNERS
jgi:hypothetical protein